MLTAIGQGGSNAEIGAALHMSVATAKTMSVGFWRSSTAGSHAARGDRIPDRPGLGLGDPLRPCPGTGVGQPLTARTSRRSGDGAL